MKKSKRYSEMLAKVPENPVDLEQAISILKGFDGTKFDQTVEIHMHLGIDPKQADQIVRGSVVLPNGIGKTQRVVVFAKDAAAAAAAEAGADEVGQEDLAKKISGGWLEFDVCIASPDMMGVVGPLGRVLGPRSLMPSPRAGTVTPDVAKAVAEYKAGKVEFRDMIAGITMAHETDKETGKKGMVVTEHKEDLHPQVVILDPKTGEVLSSYSIPVGAHMSVKEGQKVGGGTMLARTPRKVSKTKDITGGLPRIAELFEARKPKDSAIISKLDGAVSFGANVRGKKKVIVTAESGESADHLVPMNKHIVVTEGDILSAGEFITEGAISPDDLLEACGTQVLQEHLVNEVQEVYRVQGVEINDKHIEIIIRQMLRKVKITEPGDTDFLWGDQVDRTAFVKANRDVTAQGGQPAEGEPVLLGITKASLETDSFISAASFQDTTRVLTEAATLGRVDMLQGFKENVIMGHLIPAGTGFPQHKESRFEFTVEEPAPIAEETEGEGEGEEGAEGSAPADASSEEASSPLGDIDDELAKLLGGE